MTEANWAPYYGNNHEKIDPPDTIPGGMVSFARHLWMPLSKDLWEDLTHRLQISGLCIYRPGDMQWACGWGPGHCIIHLDDFGHVQDIELQPYGPSRKKAKVQEETNSPSGERPETEEGFRQEVFRLAKELLVDPDKWLDTPNPNFDNRKPSELVATHEVEKIYNALRAVDLGLF